MMGDLHQYDFRLFAEFLLTVWKCIFLLKWSYVCWCFKRSVSFSGQLVVCTLCSCVMKTKQIWLFSAHMLPLLARLCLVPLETIVIINKFAMIFTGLEVLYFLASNLLVPYNLAKSAYRELVQVSDMLLIILAYFYGFMYDKNKLMSMEFRFC